MRPTGPPLCLLSAKLEQEEISHKKPRIYGKQSYICRKKQNVCSISKQNTLPKQNNILSHGYT